LIEQACKAVGTWHLLSWHITDHHPNFLFEKAVIDGDRRQDRQGECTEVEPMSSPFKISQDWIEVAEHNVSLTIFSTNPSSILLQLVDQIFLISMAGLQVENMSVGVPFLKELQPRPLLDDRSLQGCETKTFSLQLFAQGNLLGRELAPLLLPIKLEDNFLSHC
jgi:hypothetical protein